MNEYFGRYSGNDSSEDSRFAVFPWNYPLRITIREEKEEASVRSRMDRSRIQTQVECSSGSSYSWLAHFLKLIFLCAAFGLCEPDVYSTHRPDVS